MKRFSKVTDEMLCSVIKGIANEITPKSLLRDGRMSCNINGVTSPVLSEETVKRCAYGWAYYFAFNEVKNKIIADRMVDIISAHVLRLSGKSLVALGDEDGAHVLVTTLMVISVYARVNKYSDLVRFMGWAPLLKEGEKMGAA